MYSAADKAQSLWFTDHDVIYRSFEIVDPCPLFAREVGSVGNEWRVVKTRFPVRNWRLHYHVCMYDEEAC